ncbi:M48 family metallopeptidase [Desulfogranum japonicum]|uniref:M48 family metallopeptidase n=1 Tax=Desulfogranum japonicum TaxID=231447 RepID=UPI0003FA4AB6|nr:M48 family metallopeptidase [Desulfogranum japonicum]
MNPYLVFVLVVLLGHYLLECMVSLLNLRALDPRLPREFAGVYDEEQYAKSQKYTRVTTRFGLLQNSVLTALTLGFILFGGFNLLDLLVRSPGFGPVVTGLLFIGSLLLMTMVIGLPFSIYSTFVIEERFGFNTTTVKTLILDLLKTLLLASILGAPLLGFILWFFERTGPYAWVYCWGAVVCFILVVQFLAPVVIMPLFNKFEPLEDGELKDAITEYAKQQHFTIQGIYTMDGSKRSTRANAFFTGFGRFRRIVFFDTLIEKMETEELVAILAHEMGHFKKKHILKMLCASVLQTGLMFYILSLFLMNSALFAAFQMEHVSVYASLLFFGFLYSPISTILSVFFNKVSRKNEYEADAYVVDTTSQSESLIAGLKKLSVSNLSNLTPHPLNVFLNYSHPPVMERIKALRQYAQTSKDTRDSCHKI